MNAFKTVINVVRMKTTVFGVTDRLGSLLAISHNAVIEFRQLIWDSYIFRNFLKYEKTRISLTFIHSYALWSKTK